MSALDDIGSEAAEGEGTGDSSPQREIEGLRAALQAERSKRQSSESKIAELTAKVDALSQKPEKTYTRTELQSAVDDGRLSQAEADRILDEQMRRGITEEVTKKVTGDLSQKELASRISTEIEKYTDIHPDILDAGSENRRLVAQEYKRQLEVLGKPDNMQTELDALIAVFGPSHRLAKGREKGKETHQEVGSDGGGTAAKDDGSPKLPARLKDHYSRMIDRGMYKGWDDPALKEELKYART